MPDVTTMSCSRSTAWLLATNEMRRSPAVFPMKPLRIAVWVGCIPGRVGAALRIRCVVVLMSLSPSRGNRSLLSRLLQPRRPRPILTCGRFLASRAGGRAQDPLHSHPLTGLSHPRDSPDHDRLERLRPRQDQGATGGVREVVALTPRMVHAVTPARSPVPLQPAQFAQQVREVQEHQALIRPGHVPVDGGGVPA